MCSLFFKCSINNDTHGSCSHQHQLLELLSLLLNYILHSFHASAPASLPSPIALSQDWPVCFWEEEEGGCLEGMTWVLRWRVKDLSEGRECEVLHHHWLLWKSHIFISSSHPSPSVHYTHEEGRWGRGLEFLFACSSECALVFACHVVLLDILEIQGDATLAKIQMLEQISRDCSSTPCLWMGCLIHRHVRPA